MAGTVRRASRESFELHVRSPVEWGLSRRPGVYKPKPFRPLLRPRGTPAIRNAVACAADDVGKDRKAMHENACVNHFPSGFGSLPPSPAGIIIGPAAVACEPLTAGAHVPDVHDRSGALLPSKEACGDGAVSKGESPGAANASSKKTLQLLREVAKAHGRPLSSNLPRSVQAEVDKANFMKYHVAQILEGVKKPRTAEDLESTGKAFDVLVLQLKDLREGLSDSALSRERVDIFLKVLSDSQTLGRISNVLNKVFCGHLKPLGKGAQAAGEEYGRRIVDFLFDATELHNKKRSENGTPRDGFLVHYLFNKFPGKKGGDDAELDSQFDALDGALEKLRKMECVHSDDTSKVGRLVNRLACSSSGKVLRTPSGSSAITASRAPVSASKSVETSRTGGRATHPPTPVVEAVVQRALSSSQTPVEVDTYQLPLLLGKVITYQQLRKHVYTPRHARQKSILYQGRRKPLSSSTPRITFTRHVSAVEIESIADHRNYDGSDPLRPADKEHEERVRSRCGLVSRRACLTFAMATDSDVSNRDRIASGLPSETVLNYRMHPLNP